MVLNPEQLKKDVTTMKTYQAVACALQALRVCEKKLTENPEHWGDMIYLHQTRIDYVLEKYFPSGSGFYCHCPRQSRPRFRFSRIGQESKRDKILYLGHFIACF